MVVPSPTADPTWAVRRRYFPAVEGMRGVAALAVLTGHLLLFSYSSGAGYALGRWLAPFGLVIFFVISGFLLYRPFLAARREGERVGELTPSYLWRRAVRILPGYWVALTLSTLWLGYAGVFSPDWWVYYGLLQVYSTGWIHDGLPVAWSLGVELSFYLVLPLIALVLYRRGLGTVSRHALLVEFSVLGAIFVLSETWRAVAGASAGGHVLVFDLIGCLGWFALGMALAALQVAHPSALQRLRGWLALPRLCWGLATAVFAALVVVLRSGSGVPLPVQNLVEGVALGLAAALLVAPAVLGDRGAAVRATLSSRPAVFIGTISFGIYLWHWAFLTWLAPKAVILDSAAPVLLLGVLTLVGSVIFGAASWYLVEKPLMQRARSVKALRHVREGDVEVAVPDDAPPARLPAELPAELPAD